MGVGLIPEFYGTDFKDGVVNFRVGPVIGRNLDFAEKNELFPVVQKEFVDEQGEISPTHSFERNLHVVLRISFAHLRLAPSLQFSHSLSPLEELEPDIIDLVLQSPVVVAHPFLLPPLKLKFAVDFGFLPKNLIMPLDQAGTSNHSRPFAMPEPKSLTKQTKTTVQIAKRSRVCSRPLSLKKMARIEFILRFWEFAFRKKIRVNSFEPAFPQAFQCLR